MSDRGGTKGWTEICVPPAFINEVGAIVLAAIRAGASFAQARPELGAAAARHLKSRKGPEA